MSDHVAEAWDKVRGPGDAEFAAADPEFQMMLTHAAGLVREGGSTGIAGLEKFEEELRSRLDVKETQAGAAVAGGAPRMRDVSAESRDDEDEAEEDPEAKALKDAAAAGSRVEASGPHSPGGHTAARPLAAEAPGNLPSPEEAEEEDEGESASSKRGALPDGFPGKAALEAAGITTWGKLRKVKDRKSIPGIGDATDAQIEEAMNE